jgi:hypothetical protein
VDDTITLSEQFNSRIRLRLLLQRTCCRSLTFDFDQKWEWGVYPPFFVIVKMAGLTRLHVACQEEEAVSLKSLHDLKELTYKNSALLLGPVIFGAAELTKLTMDLYIQRVRSRHHVKHSFHYNDGTQKPCLKDCPCSVL